MNKIKILLVAVVIILILLGLKLFLKNHAEIYSTKDIEKCTIMELVEASGTINPVNTVSVGSTVSGLIKEIYVDFNSEVKKGQILAQIDPATFQATVQQTTANINSAQANLAKLEARADLYQKTYTRYKNLYKRNFVAKSELDQAESDYYSNLAEINQAKAQISQAQAQFQTAKTNLGYTRIIAPVNGTIISRKIDLGQPVAASFQAPELFTIAQDLTKMQIEVSVSEADIGKIKEGQDVIYTLDGYANEHFDGKVTQVRISPTTVSNVVTYSVIVEVDNEDFKLKPGMTANVSIIANKKENILCAPNQSLKVSIDGKKYENTGVWILKNRKPARIDIKTGISNDSVTEIVSNEINVGDKVIIKNNNNKKSSKTTMRPRMF